MTVEEWSIVIGVVMAGILALGPWMFMVHAKLAVIASQLDDLYGEVKKLSEKQWRMDKTGSNRDALL